MSNWQKWRTMMDNKRRELERKALSGDIEAAAALERSLNRSGEGRLALFRRFIGETVYIEGARMNYYGQLSGVTGAPDGSPAELLFATLFRVGDWDENGPSVNRTQEMPCTAAHPGILPYAAIDQFSLVPSHWPK